MEAPTTDRPHVGTDLASTPGDSPRPPASGSLDFEVGNRGFKPWKVILAFVLVIAIAAITVFGVVRYMGEQGDAKLRKEQSANAKRDLNNRIATEDLTGNFTDVFYVGKQMRARWESDDGKKRCVMVVAPPTEDVLRYSTLDVPDNTAGFKQFDDRNAVGCLTSGGAGGIGGG